MLRYEKRTLHYADELVSAEDLTAQEETVLDALAAAALRTMPEISAEGIFVLGHSLGEQTGYIISLEKESTAEQLSVLADLEEQIERVKDPGLSLDTPAEQLPLDIPAAYWLDLRDYDPPALARDLHRPLLVIQGDRDYRPLHSRQRRAVDGRP